MIGKHLRGGEG